MRGLSPARSTTAAPPRPGLISGRCAQPSRTAGSRRQGHGPDGSRVHSDSLDEGGARLCPCGIAASTPQSFLTASLAACADCLRSFPPRHEGAGARRSRPRSARFEPVSHKGAVTHRFLAYSSPSRSPDPGHLAVLARPGFVRAAPALPGTTRLRLPSAPPSRCDGISGEGLSPPLETLRLTAHAHAATRVHHCRSLDAGAPLRDVQPGLACGLHRRRIHSRGSQIGLPTICPAAVGGRADLNMATQLQRSPTVISTATANRRSARLQAHDRIAGSLRRVGRSASHLSRLTREPLICCRRYVTSDGELSGVLFGWCVLLRGRAAECAAIQGLLAGTRQGASGALVMRAEAGMGKTAMMAYAVSEASGIQVFRLLRRLGSTGCPLPVCIVFWLAGPSRRRRFRRFRRTRCLAHLPSGLRHGQKIASLFT